MSEGLNLLAEGLSNGYTGNTKFETIGRADFSLKSSFFQTQDGGVYIDQWLNASTGGGQEIARAANGNMWTRLYAGGVIEAEQLSGLGISEKDVIKYLIQKVGELGNTTRLLEDCNPKADQLWQYIYEITNRMPEIELTLGLEKILYKNKLVFAHAFQICKVTNY